MTHADEPVACRARARRCRAACSRVDGVQVAHGLADQADHDHQDDRAGEQVGGHRERPARLLEAAQVAEGHEHHHADADLQLVRADRRDRRRHRRRSRRHLDRHRDHVVDQQRDRADLRDPRAEVLPGHHVGAAGPDVDHDDLAVREHHERHHEQDDQGQRQDQGERRQAGHRQQRDQDLLGAVGGGGDAVGRQDAERERLGQPLLAELLVDERRPEQLRLRRIPEGVRLAAGPVEQARRLGHRHCVAFRMQNVQVPSYHAYL